MNAGRSRWERRSLRIWAGAGFALLAAGCITGEKRGVPLYPNDGALPAPESVARLVGYVRFVDGKDVSDHGSSFELLPGCHLVGTPDKWGEVDPNAGGVIVETGKQTFVLPMKAGHTYAVRVDVHRSGGPTGFAGLGAEERGPDGKITRHFAPAKSVEELEQCRAERTSTGVPAR